MFVSNKAKVSGGMEARTAENNISFNVNDGSMLHQILLKNPKLIFGHFNNMFKYDNRANKIIIRSEFSALLKILKSCNKKDPHKIGLENEPNNFADIRQALNNLDFNTAFGSDKNADGSHVERWHLLEDGISLDVKENLKDIVMQLGFTNILNNTTQFTTPKQAIILGARSERMELRIRQSLNKANQNGNINHEDVYFLSGDRKIDTVSGKDELNFLSSLGIDISNISSERDAQKALVNYVCDDIGISMSQREKFTFITGYSDDSSRRANASDTTKALFKHVTENNKQLTSISTLIEQPYGRLADQLIDSLINEIGVITVLDQDIELALSQVEKTYSIDDKAPIKITLNEMVKQYNRAVLQIESYNNI